MKRREFIRQGAAASLLLGTGLGTLGCSRNLREEIVGPEISAPDKEAFLAPWGWEILYYASLAPSGHNSQPWFVRPEAEDVWVVGADPRRWLPAVDPENREVLLSIGAFLENLVQAASVKGVDAEVEMLTEKRHDQDLARVRLNRTKATTIPLERLTTRRTLKTGLLPREIRAADIRQMETLTGGGLYYFPMASEHGQFMAEAALENFRIQFENEAAMAEAVSWTRLSHKDAAKYRDGLTPDGMEIHGLAGLWVRHFMDVAEVSGKTWRDGAVDKLAGQVREGAGWLVITSPGQSVADLIEAGRRFQRMALMAREMGIALHPMTQTLEEPHGKRQIRENHNPGMIPQFMLRVGYVDAYPAPVSLRRPVSWFLV